MAQAPSRCVALMHLVITLVLVVLLVIAMSVWIWEEVTKPEMYFANNFVDNIMFPQARYVLMLGYGSSLVLLLLVQLGLNVGSDGSDDAGRARRMVWTLTSILLILTFIGSSLLALSYNTYKLDDLQASMTGAIQEDYVNNSAYTDTGSAFNQAQSLLSCCGVNADTDYAPTNFEFLTENTVPYSCCALQSNKGGGDTAVRDVVNWTLCESGHVDFRNTGGCYDVVLAASSSMCEEITILGFTSAGIMLLAVCLRLGSEMFAESKKRKQLDALVKKRSERTFTANKSVEIQQDKAEANGSKNALDTARSKEVAILEEA